MLLVQPAPLAPAQFAQTLTQAQARKPYLGWVFKDVFQYLQPACQVAQVLHQGPVPASDRCYERLHGYMGTCGYTPAGHFQEIYLTDPHQTHPEDQATIFRRPARLQVG